MKIFLSFLLGLHISDVVISAADTLGNISAFVNVTGAVKDLNYLAHLPIKWQMLCGWNAEKFQ